MLESLNLTANGTAGPVSASGDVFYQIQGTWGSGTLSVQVDFGNGYLEELSLTADAQGILELPRQSAVGLQFVLSGATSPDIDIDLR